MNAKLEMTLRVRRRWLIPVAVHAAAVCSLVSTPLGNRVVNAGLWLARYEYRFGNRGRWQRLPLPPVEITDDGDDDGTSVLAGAAT